ncbi:MAG: type II toxin-antitoxin system HicB family antitoxin [Methanosarcinales archaeon]
MNKEITIEKEERIYRVYLEKDKESGYIVYCPTLRGCYSQGETREDAIENIKEAIEGYIESLKKRGLSIPYEKDLIEIELLEVFV